eukprot:scaffold44992_cov86-Cyclotella_meneghiniana.AAC.4
MVQRRSRWGWGRMGEDGGGYPFECPRDVTGVSLKPSHKSHKPQATYQLSTEINSQDINRIKQYHKDQRSSSSSEGHYLILLLLQPCQNYVPNC